MHEQTSRVKLSAISSNEEIDDIYEHYQNGFESIRHELNAALGTEWEEWQIPREAGAE